MIQISFLAPQTVIRDMGISAGPSLWDLVNGALENYPFLVGGTKPPETKVIRPCALCVWLNKAALAATAENRSLIPSPGDWVCVSMYDSGLHPLENLWPV